MLQCRVIRAHSGSILAQHGNPGDSDVNHLARRGALRSSSEARPIQRLVFLQCAHTPWDIRIELVPSQLLHRQ